MQSHNLRPFQTTHSRWRAITQRDPAAHCSFIYAVKTTGIYCRPTCTARIARRANIVYFETRDEAEKNGFRPCTKCKPDEAAFMGQREEIVLRTLDLIRLKEDSAKVDGGLKELAKNVGVTPSYLCRVFKKTMGCTLGQYCRYFELEAVQSEAKSSVGSIDATESELQPWARPPEAVSTISEPLVPVGYLPTRPSQYPVQSSTGFEEDIDLNFDFDEWLWTEGFDFDTWIAPDLEISHGDYSLHSAASSG